MQKWISLADAKPPCSGFYKVETEYCDFDDVYYNDETEIFDYAYLVKYWLYDTSCHLLANVNGY